MIEFHGSNCSSSTIFVLSFLNNREDKLFHILINRIKDKTLRKRELTIEEDLVTSWSRGRANNLLVILLHREIIGDRSRK